MVPVLMSWFGPLAVVARAVIQAKGMREPAGFSCYETLSDLCRAGDGMINRSEL